MYIYRGKRKRLYHYKNKSYLNGCPDYGKMALVVVAAGVTNADRRVESKSSGTKQSFVRNSDFLTESLFGRLEEDGNNSQQSGETTAVVCLI